MDSDIKIGYSTRKPVGFDSQNCTDSLDNQIKNLTVSEPDQYSSAMETDSQASQMASNASTGPTLPPVDTLDTEMLDFEADSGSQEVKQDALPKKKARRVSGKVKKEAKRKE